ncbi:MAG: radical SAM protein [Acidobacteria bacterium]|nr:radical SAM protein [Acidobacteriota bacterium]
MKTGDLTTVEYLNWFSRLTTHLRVPLSGGLELTRRCDLRCTHCYVGDRAAGGLGHKPELPTRRWHELLDEITAAGCLYLLLTGGEPLLHPDFPALYRHAKGNGLVVTVFTNGNRVDDSILDLWRDLPPHTVEISLYGATAAVYEAVTRVPGSFDRCMAGVRALVEAGLPLRLKTVLLTTNRHEFAAMKALAEELNAPFRFDAAVFPRLDGDRAPLALRVPPEAAVELEFTGPERLHEYLDYLKRHEGAVVAENLYSCGAGMTLFHVSAEGRLQPCLMARDPAFDLTRGDFGTGWLEITGRLREWKTPAGFRCRECRMNVLCGYCPAFFGLETGAEDTCSDYICAMGRERWERIRPWAEEKTR